MSLHIAVAGERYGDKYVHSKIVLQVSYVKALDMYFIISFLFVFGAMLEYVAVMVHGQTKKGKQLAPNDSLQKSFTEVKLCTPIYRCSLLSF